jgi:hypothetical protein
MHMGAFVILGFTAGCVLTGVLARANFNEAYRLRKQNLSLKTKIVKLEKRRRKALHRRLKKQRYDKSL